MSDDDEVLECEACGDECDGASECSNCSRTICLNCEREYEEACPACIDEVLSKETDDD